MLPATFDPAVTAWFEATFAAPTRCQQRAWAALASGRHTLVAAPTGSGKTLAAFLTAISELAGALRDGTLAAETRVLYVSPLKALSNDIQRNLEQPLAAIQAALRNALGDEVPPLTTAVRTGDTSTTARAHMRKHPPHILVTTPESLYILLTSESGRESLKTVRTVIVDEIHALAGNKRGQHLALSLARLDRLTGTPAVRIGLSATQRPLARIAEFLCGVPPIAARAVDCEIIDEGHLRAREIAIEMPLSPLETVVSAEVAGEIRARMIELIACHRTTLVFVNTRRMAERLARALADELGETAVCSHHGSMSRERRLDAERRLKQGELQVLVATASLELGIDIGDVDLVCQLGSTRSLATLLQRVGRSGHAIDGIARGRLFPQTRDELIDAIALQDMLARDELDQLELPSGALDVLAQQVVAEVSCGDCTVESLYQMCRSAWSYRELSEHSFRQLIVMLAEGFSFARGRRSAYLHFDAINDSLRARRGARLTAITCGGAIPDSADYDVIAEPRGELVGTVNEDFAIESLPGNIFQLGNTSWRVLRVEPAGLRVEDAAGEPPNMPFWLGEAPSRSAEFSFAVSRLRAEFAARVDSGETLDTLATWLTRLPGIGIAAARQAADYLYSGYRALGAMPTQDTLVMERFFDESGGMQLVIHSPFGSRLNKAWGLALRKRFCRTFNFELQAAAIEDALVISLGAVHSFPLEEVWRYLNSATVRDVLTQALLDAPMFKVRWRWVAGCALAIERFRSGRKVPPRLLRMNADDLAAVVFPDQLACAENLNGRREIPDHPLVTQSIADCLHEAMDVIALERLLDDMAAGRKRLVARDLTEPSPFAAQVLNANPYAFLDDAPLEERRTQAVQSRRWLDPATASDLGQLDPGAIARVRSEVWPQPQSADELHEAVLLLGWAGQGDVATMTVPMSEGARGSPELPVDEWLAQLLEAGRVVEVDHPRPGWVATERRHEFAAVWPATRYRQSRVAQAYCSSTHATADAALEALLLSRLEMTGPQATATLAELFPVGLATVRAALASLEARGVIMRGQYLVEVQGEQWCERRLLARIHRYTLNRLRAEIESVSSATFMMFLVDWQYAASASRLEGAAGLEAVVAQLCGFESPAAAWEADILPQRVRGFHSAMLDDLIRAGRYRWLRLTPKHSSTARPAGTLRNTPLALVQRTALRAWLAAAGPETGTAPTGAAAAVLDYIAAHGAAFFDDLVEGTGLLWTQTENALDELAAAGLVSCDSFAGLRALTTPSAKRQSPGRRSRRTTAPSIADAGRWSRIQRPTASAAGVECDSEVAESIARMLLRRYGVVFRKLLERESGLPPWRHLLWALRRLEAAGEIRGGRFVAGYSGEQFALPEAVAALRAGRKQNLEQRADQRIDVISAADPLNLLGVLLPGVRLPALVGHRLALLGGEPAAVVTGREPLLLRAFDTATALRIRTALLNPFGLSGGAAASPRRRSYRY